MLTATGMGLAHFFCAMKRSVRKLTRYRVSLFSRRIGDVRQIVVCRRTWTVRHLEVQRTRDSSLYVPVVHVLGVDSDSREIEIGVRGSLADDLVVGEHPNDEVVGSLELSGLSVPTLRGAHYRLVDLVVDDRSWRVDYILAASPDGRTELVPAVDVASVDVPARRIHVSRLVPVLRN